MKCIELEMQSPDPEVDQKELEERLCKKTARHVN